MYEQIEHIFEKLKTSIHPIIIFMNSLPKKFVPVALLGVLTSSLLYGCIPYTVTSAQGGPVSDAIGSVISFAEAQLSESLSFETVIVDVKTSSRSSFWLSDSNDDKFPRGTKVAVVKFVVTNNSTKPVDVFGLYVKAWFEGSDRLASPVTPAKDAPHAEQGYPEYLIDLFNPESDTWIIPAGESLTFAESFYVEGDADLNVSVVAPERDDVTDTQLTSSEVFRLVI